MSKQLESRMVEEKGVTLAWKRRERYGPYTTVGGVYVDNPPKGSVIEQGEVWVTLDELLAVAERTIDDYLWGDTPPNISYHGQLALVEKGWAVEETRGGIHGTDKLKRWLKRVGQY